MNCSFVFPVCLAGLGPGHRMRPGAGFTAQQLLWARLAASCGFYILPATTCHLNTDKWHHPQYMKRRQQVGSYEGLANVSMCMCTYTNIHMCMCISHSCHQYQVLVFTLREKSCISGSEGVILGCLELMLHVMCM